MKKSGALDPRRIQRGGLHNEKRCSARDGDLANLATCKKAHPLAIGREEWVAGPLRTGQWTPSDAVEVANEQADAPTLPGNVGQAGAVLRYEGFSGYPLHDLYDLEITQFFAQAL